MIKLATGGGSIGLYQLNNLKDLPSLHQEITNSTHAHRTYFAEKFIPGRVFSLGLLSLPTKEIILPILEIKPQEENFYSLDVKMNSKKEKPLVKYQVPAKLSQKLTLTINKQAKTIFTKSHTHGFARLDFIIHKNQIYWLEMNTIPGIQPHSNYNLCLESAGFTFNHLLLALLYQTLA